MGSDQQGSGSAHCSREHRVRGRVDGEALSEEPTDHRDGERARDREKQLAGLEGAAARAHAGDLAVADVERARDGRRRDVGAVRLLVERDGGDEPAVRADGAAPGELRSDGLRAEGVLVAERRGSGLRVTANRDALLLEALRRSLRGGR